MISMIPNTSTAIALATVADDTLVSDWLATKSPRTRTAYAGDLGRFAEYLGAELRVAVAELLGAGSRAARHTVIEYRKTLLERALSPATINRALAALRSVVELARTTGIIDWSLEVANVRARAYRDTRGPVRTEVAAMLRSADAETDRVTAARNGALLRLLYGLALRRAEAAELNIEHVDLAGRTVSVRGKGYCDRAPLTLPARVCDAVRAWLSVHPAPAPDAPLFVALDRAHRGGRLTDRSIARVVESTCEAAGVRVVSPHALRHAAITHALDATGGDVRKVRAFSRHAKLETLVTYDDNRRDGAGAVAELVAL